MTLAADILRYCWEHGNEEVRTWVLCVLETERRKRGLRVDCPRVH